MENEQKKQLSDKLKKALLDEHLWAKDAAGYLNLNPTYISMMLNPKFFDKCGATAWKRIEEWANTGDKISNFILPANEKRREKEKVQEPVSKEPMSKKDKTHSEISPEVIPPIKVMPDIQIAEDPIRLRVALDLEINVHVNGTRVRIG